MCVQYFSPAPKHPIKVLRIGHPVRYLGDTLVIGGFGVDNSAGLAILII
jgi:hypothetical protein